MSWLGTILGQNVKKENTKIKIVNFDKARNSNKFSQHVHVMANLKSLFFVGILCYFIKQINLTF